MSVKEGSGPRVFCARVLIAASGSEHLNKRAGRIADFHGMTLRPDERVLLRVYYGTQGTRLSISNPTSPLAISRRAVTVGLSLVSTFGA